MKYQLSYICQNGIDSFTLKIIALCFMTCGYMAAYSSEIPIVSVCSSILHLVGILSAPLFLFLLVYSARYTHSKIYFLLRLYLSAIAIGLLECFLKVAYLNNNIGMPWFNNILFTYFYTVAYIYLIEAFCKSNYRFWSLLGIIVITVIPNRLWHFIDHSILFQSILQYNHVLGRSLLDVFFSNPIHTEYGLQFILLGIFLYFAKNKKKQCLFFILFCLFWPTLYFLVSNANFVDLHDILRYIPHMVTYMDFTQWFMILALPFMMLYNGKSNNRYKWFFYAYYPIHRNILFLLGHVFV